MKVENLSFGYKEPLAENLSFELPYGLTCLIGPNGSGKSTFLRTIAGLIKPLAGSVFIFEKNCSDINAKDLAKLIAFVPSRFPAETSISVFDFVSLGRIPHTNAFGKLGKHDLESTNFAMEQAEVADFAKRRVNSLSDGEKQRVALARALAQDTQILLMDEPTAFLDYPNRIKLFEFLSEKQKNKICLTSTHELDLARHFASHILQINGHGKVSLSSADKALFQFIQIQEKRHEKPGQTHLNLYE
ncbi:MAG: ABC transporter ATP-binding protein [Fibromonadaceae bacterium]|jgi:iron complex transport system ATP-binding protein|nr:ABC transporter ATP-binding protein [Fibromonadaceae bacterium]